MLDNVRPIRKDKPLIGIILIEKEGMVEIEEVIKDSPAEIANLKKGDILKKIDSVSIKSRDSFLSIVQEKKVGTKIILTVMRNGELISLPLILGTGSSYYEFLEK